MTDIIERLRQTRADMLGTEDEQHYSDCHEAADTIEALRAENARLRKELRDADEMLLGQARTIRDYQDAAMGETE